MGQLADCAGTRQGKVHVWTGQLVDDDATTEEFVCILDGEERERARRLRLEQHRRYFIQSHGILRRILASYAGVDAAALTFHRGSHGKPFLVLPGWGSELHFSLAHSGSCCMVAVRSGGPVGIDVEQFRDMPNATDIADRMFTRAESALVSSLAGGARQDAFFTLWTFKEAVIKALGRNLESLDRVQFDMDPAGSLRFVSLDGEASAAELWCVRRLDGPTGYVAAVAGCPGFTRVQHFAWRGTRLSRGAVDEGQLVTSPLPQLDNRFEALPEAV
jgi:4'-phosphopantetheinyl transferase